METNIENIQPERTVYTLDEIFTDSFMERLLSDHGYGNDYLFQCAESGYYYCLAGCEPSDYCLFNVEDIDSVYTIKDADDEVFKQYKFALVKAEMEINIKIK